MKKFNEFQYIRETSIVLAGVDEKTCTLSDYKHKIDEAMAIKEEMSNFFESEITESYEIPEGGILKDAQGNVLSVHTKHYVSGS